MIPSRGRRVSSGRVRAPARPRSRVANESAVSLERSVASRRRRCGRRSPGPIPAGALRSVRTHDSATSDRLYKVSVVAFPSRCAPPPRPLHRSTPTRRGGDPPLRLTQRRRTSATLTPAFSNDSADRADVDDISRFAHPRETPGRDEAARGNGNRRRNSGETAAECQGRARAQLRFIFLLPFLPAYVFRLVRLAYSRGGAARPYGREPSA